MAGKKLLEPFLAQRRVRLTLETRAASPSEDTMAAINRYTLRTLEPADVITFSALIANDQVDSYSTQFTRGALEQIAALLPGNKVMRNHSAWLAIDMPVGVWYASGTLERAGIGWARGDFYMPRDDETETLASRIQAGAIDEVSLAWYLDAMVCSICQRDMLDEDSGCPHVPGVAYSGRVAVGIMPTIRSVDEASLVWKGGQYGTTIMDPDGDQDQEPDADDVPAPGTRRTIHRHTLMHRMAAKRAAHQKSGRDRAPAGLDELFAPVPGPSLDDLIGR